jgi:hypothetical protein
MATVIKLKRDASEEELKKIQEQVARETKKGFDAYKYCGVIKLTEDPLEFQKRIRDEWE